jgi:hydrogenase maturation protease
VTGSVTRRTLVAGVGNVFLRDDAFGVEVVKLLTERPRPPGVEIRDFGIRGVHLAYDLLNGCDLFVLVDAAVRGGEPGTVSVLEVDPPDADPGTAPLIDAHGLTPDDVFSLLASLGGRPARSLVVACEPADVSAGMGLSEPVRAALPYAVRAVEDILARASAHQASELEGGGARDGDQADHGGRDSGGGRDSD